MWARTGVAYDWNGFVRAQRGWDCSESVTDRCNKVPLLRRVEAAELEKQNGQPLDENGVERTAMVTYRPQQLAEDRVYAVNRRDGIECQLQRQR